MSVLEFTVPGEPVSKGRPRFTRTGFAYTDKRTASFENLVRLAYAEKYPDRVPSDVSISLYVDAYFSIPKSWSKKKRADAANNIIFKTSRPDLDNIVKAISDGLNGVAWIDDAQITEFHSWKGFSENPRTEVIISLCDGEEEQ